MSMSVRRVITGHDDAGKSVVIIDDTARNGASRRHGHDSRVIWMTEPGQAPNAGREDAGARPIGRPPPRRGTLFRVMELQPDQELEMHATATIDYVVVIEGTLNLVLDDSEVPLRPGDCLVQRGTNHAWRNTGTGPCRLAAVLIDAD